MSFRFLGDKLPHLRRARNKGPRAVFEEPRSLMSSLATTSHRATPRRIGQLLLIIAAAAVLLIAAPGRASAAKSFDSQGMWIWYVTQAERGDVKKIIAKAKRYKVKTLFVKSGDGANWWKQWETYAPQFKAAGLNVCAWQYIYGSYPIVEAELAARAARLGADCIVINAEVEYKNRHRQAEQYIKALRAQVGADYPVGFTSFAYPDYHPTVPYSVFLGPGGAQWNLPQMYFWAFKSSIPTVFQHTYQWNQIYQRPIHPLGQTYAGTPASRVLSFRKYAKKYKAKGYSWWVWHETRPGAWKSLATPFRRLPKRRATPYPLLKQGYKSDMVRWAKLKLNADGARLKTTLSFDAKMTIAVKAFQTRNGIPASGMIGVQTWPILQAVKLPPLK